MCTERIRAGGGGAYHAWLLVHMCTVSYLALYDVVPCLTPGYVRSYCIQSRVPFQDTGGGLGMRLYKLYIV